MIFFCPICWKELGSDQQTCLNCGAKVSSFDDQTFTVKLVRALSHPEPETRMRAVYLLGETKTKSAFDALTQLYRNTIDPFLQAEIVKALDKIGDDATVGFLIEALRHPSFIVRQEAAGALMKYPGTGRVKRTLGNPAG